MKIKVLTGVLSAGLIAVVSGNVFASESVDKQESANKHFTHAEVRDGNTYYENEYKNTEISSDYAIPEEVIEGIIVDNSEEGLEDVADDILVDESFTGTIQADSQERK